MNLFNQILLVLGVLICSASFGQDNEMRTIFGTLSEKSNGEPLINASVYDTISKKGVLLNEYGFYSLTIPNQDAVLRISNTGLGTQYFNVPVGMDEFNMQIEAIQELSEITVNSKTINDANVGEMVLDMQTMNKLPVFLGENDVLRMIALLPGVSSGGEGSTGIYVRGGGPDQNLILLDGVPVYNVSHLFGFFSVFNSDAISKVTLTKSGFPSRYGGRVSSVLDMRLKEGNTKTFHTEGSIGLIASRILVEGPIKKDKTSFAISARRTYIDILTYPFQLASDEIDGLAGYYFYDVNAKLQHKINDKHHLYLSGYFGKDRGFLRDNYEDEFNKNSERINLFWGNAIGALRWNYRIQPKLFLMTTASYSQYRFELNAENESTDKQTGFTSGARNAFFSGIRDFTVKSDLGYSINSDIQLLGGVGSTIHQFTPGALSFEISSQSNPEFNQDTVLAPNNINSVESWFFAEVNQNIGSRLKLNYGIHTSIFNSTTKTYFEPQPRLSASYLTSEKGSLKLGGSRSVQYLHLLTNQGLGLPTDLWVPATADIPPVKSWEGSIGYHHDLPKNFFFSVETYYKYMKDVTQYREGADFISITESLENKVVSGKGESYGAEFFVQRKKGRFTGWVGYTLSWSTRQYDEINGGEKFFYKYDRRHDVSITGAYQITKKWDVSAVFVFWTGNALTLPTQNYFSSSSSTLTGSSSFQGKNIQYFENVNNYRMPNYHRMDVSANRTRIRSWGESVFSISVYNVYNRQNAFFLETSQVNNKKILQQRSLFPIMPSISWKFIFDYSKMNKNKSQS